MIPNIQKYVTRNTTVLISTVLLFSLVAGCHKAVDPIIGTWVSNNTDQYAVYRYAYAFTDDGKVTMTRAFIHKTFAVQDQAKGTYVYNNGMLTLTLTSDIITRTGTDAGSRASNGPAKPFSEKVDIVGNKMLIHEGTFDNVNMDEHMTRAISQ